MTSNLPFAEWTDFGNPKVNRQSGSGIVLPNRTGGLAMPNTPEGVAFYLDQAAKSHSVGANSAAIAMYRGALEHLLFQQGYKTGMLANMAGRQMTLQTEREVPHIPRRASHSRYEELAI